MGEISAKGERILGDYVENQVVLHANICLSIKSSSALLYSFYVDKLKYFQSKAVSL